MRSIGQVMADGRELRDLALRLAKQHDQESHGGNVCRLERANLTAYVAHSLGLRPGDMLLATTLLADYEEHCPGKDCPHDEGRG
jgi:tRNA U34 2-thiouridine synthase MnmA/TrmU